MLQLFKHFMVGVATDILFLYPPFIMDDPRCKTFVFTFLNVFAEI